MNDLFTLSVSPWDLVIRAVVVYLVVLLLLRLAGRKQIAQMGPTELVAMLLISNAVQNSMNAGDNSLAGGLISAAVLVTLSHGISWLTFKSRKASDLIEGKPITLVSNGKILPDGLKKVLMPRTQLFSMLAAQGIEDISKIRHVIMDPEGRLIVIQIGGQLDAELEKPN